MENTCRMLPRDGATAPAEPGAPAILEMLDALEAGVAALRARAEEPVMRRTTVPPPYAATRRKAHPFARIEDL